mmetsp:Transcript_21530/g.69504  ORF Transcript_21530/g.69504 Transcript_21530/m.69504 type:complete len:208 (+) Transcript_21530:79-702(+)
MSGGSGYSSSANLPWYSPRLASSFAPGSLQLRPFGMAGTMSTRAGPSVRASARAGGMAAASGGSGGGKASRASETVTTTSCSRTHVVKLKMSVVRKVPTHPGLEEKRMPWVCVLFWKSCSDLPGLGSGALSMKLAGAPGGWNGTSIDSSSRACVDRLVSAMFHSTKVPAATGLVSSRASYRMMLGGLIEGFEKRACRRSSSSAAGLL